jgi:psp operon transcriptional activator
MFKQHDNLIGQANSFLEILEQTSMVAPLNKPVLVIGERGTGKELIAARLHFLSKRWEQNYVKLNCAALNDNLLESELFGHEGGAFSGASKRREGRFEYADQGTLFLDELANTSTLIQEKLLRVIEYGEFERVGGSRPVKVDVRIIAATNEDLPSLAQAGDFRADLLDRLAFDVITIPPLRARKADIMMLAEHFAINMARELKLELFAGFTRKSRDLLLDYSWPGNIRELKNVVERAVYRTPPNVPVHDIILDPFDSKFRPSSRAKFASTNAASTQDIMPKKPTASADIIGTTDLFGGISATNDFAFPIDLKQTSQDYEISMLQQALKDSQYNQKKTAEKLSLTYHQLRGYLKKYNLLENTESM